MLTRDGLIAERMKKAKPSGMTKYNEKLAEMKRAGMNVIGFKSRQDTPQHIKDAAKKMLDSPDAASYVDLRGLSELRRSIADKLKEQNSIDADPDDQIVVTVGAHAAILATMLALINPGDEILVEDPGWITYTHSIHLAGGVPVPVPLVEKKGWKLSHEEMEKRIGPKTKMIVINNPHNPTGRVLTKDDIEEIIEVAKNHELLILVDEAFENYVYDGLKHYSIASFPGMAERTITIQTTSKLFNMYGWRLGWVTGSKEIIQQMAIAHSHMVACATSFVQAGAIAALNQKPVLGLGGMTLSELRSEYTKRRDAMVDGLNRIPGISCVKGNGGYHAFPNFSAFGMSSAEMYDYLLEKARVHTTPGGEFGAVGEGHLRFHYTCPVNEIEKGLEQIRVALQAKKIVAKT
jgi:aspartate/methionine/tyrosine aminotransferase